MDKERRSVWLLPEERFGGSVLGVSVILTFEVNKDERRSRRLLTFYGTGAVDYFYHGLSYSRGFQAMEEDMCGDVRGASFSG